MNEENTQKLNAGFPDQGGSSHTPDSRVRILRHK